MIKEASPLAAFSQQNSPLQVFTPLDENTLLATSPATT